MRRHIIAVCAVLSVLASGLACSGDGNGLSGIWAGTMKTSKRSIEIEFRFRNDGLLEVAQTSDGITRTQVGAYELSATKLVFSPTRVRISNLTPEQNAELSDGIQSQKPTVTYLLTRKGPDELSVLLENSSEDKQDPMLLKRRKD